MIKSFTKKDIQIAYKKFKRFVYYDKNDLTIRNQLAKFECSGNLDKKFEEILDVINDQTPSNHEYFRHWLELITFRMSIKKIQNDANAKNPGTFLSNVTSSKNYTIESVNYFFKGPIQLHLIAILWIMKEGYLLDSALGNNCYGSRLETNIHDSSEKLFHRYHEYYKKWRDEGIKTARKILLEEKKDVCILGLDIREYYYHINIDYRKIGEDIASLRLKKNSNSQSYPNLLKCIKQISLAYKEKIQLSVNTTHQEVPPLTSGIPIGLASSPILANWYLKQFDESVQYSIRPLYYGRYIDDILIVIPPPQNILASSNPIEKVIQENFIKNKIFKGKENDQYQFTTPSGLFLHEKKLILQHFDSNHSIASLEKFQKELDENSSHFLLLPEDEEKNFLENVSYDQLYNGSANEFRGAKSVSENRFELATYLSHQTKQHLLTDDSYKSETSDHLLKFFIGKNAIEFHDLWERVFTFFIVANDMKSFIKFDENILNEIKRVVHSDAIILQKIQNDLKNHLRQSKNMGKALNGYNPEIRDDLFYLRKSNLIRHHFVPIPLLNYTNSTGSLVRKKLIAHFLFP